MSPTVDPPATAGSTVPPAVAGGRTLPSIAIVGAGRVGATLYRLLHADGQRVDKPYGRGYDGAGAEIVLLAVPDDAIAAAAGAIRPGPVLGHLSGATGLAALGASRDAFSLHPLMTITGTEHSLAGVPAALAATSERAAAAATAVARTLGLQVFAVAEADRAAYHAGSAMAANFLITLQWAAARLLRDAGVDPAVVLPLARAALDNWAAIGPAALTGPVARGDEGTVAAHRRAVSERAPDLLRMYDEMVATTQWMMSQTAREVRS